MSKKNAPSNKNNYSSALIWINAVISVVAFSLFIAMNLLFKSDLLKSGIIIFLVYIAVLLLCNGIYRFLTIRTPVSVDEEIKPFLGNITLDLMVKLYMPILICSDNGKIVWYNKSFSALTKSRSSLYGRSFEEFCDKTLEEIVSCENNEGLDSIAFNSFYKIKGYGFNADKMNFVITVWSDKSELHEAYRKIAQEDTLVAYIVIDNLDELLQYVQEKYRSASAEVESILKNWADSVDGIFKEYERDKFIFLFHSKHLSDFVTSRFEILDKVRDIRVGEGSLPVTVSMGISQITGTLAEKEKAAHAALDMALQRGGDQVVVKGKNEMEFYGGKVQTAQKRTKVRARVVADELAMLVAKSSNVLVMGHVHPDFDSIGSCIGIARLALFCGVKVNIITNLNSPDMKKCYSKLIQLPEYNEHEIFIDGHQAQELIESETLLVIVDTNHTNQFEAPEIADNTHNIVVIDHHRKNAEFSYNPIVSYIEPSASSSCELVAEILEQALPSGSLTREEADIILAGIMLDTKQFLRNTGSRTFGAALYLRNEGANPAMAQELFKTNLEDLMREAVYESNVVIYRGIIAIAQNDKGGNTAINRVAAAKAADKLLNVEGVMASFVVCSVENSIHISARSSGKINVQLILEKLGGGGHFDSAATQFKNVTMTDALTKLKEAIDEYLTTDESSLSK